jgi:predicted RNA-binding protein with TRAM domain
MDHRGLLVIERGLVIVGGMEKGQQVTAKVTLINPSGK